jgi:hypothetical protein
MTRLSILILFLCFAAGSPTLAQLFDESRYEGLRCGVVQIRDLRQQGADLSFVCDLANTGREGLHFRGDGGQAVLFVFDGSLESAGLTERREEIACHILRSGWKLPQGAFLQAQRITLPADALPFSGESQPALPKETGSVEELVYYPRNQEEPCPDLVVDTLLLHRDKGHRLDITLRIRNQGDAPARIYVPAPGKKYESMGVTFFLGNAPTISRSSLFIQGDHVRKGLDPTGGWLAPGATMDWPVRLRPDQRPAHLRMLQCQLDNYQFVMECDQTNNAYALPLPAR